MNIRPSKRLGEVKEYYFSKKLKEIAAMQQKGNNVINLGIGNPDLPPPLKAVQTLHTESIKATVHGYQSYNGLPELRDAFAQWYQRHYGVYLDAHEEVLPLIGSKEGIMHISMTYLDEGDEVLIPNPGYPAYQAIAHLTGAKTREYSLDEENNWLPDLEALAKTDLTKVKLMWVNYPNMPTGAKACLSFFEKLVAFAKQHHILICNDNPYSFILNDNPISILSVKGAKAVALELNSLSKAHNMAGWRIGMVAGAAHYLKDILRFKSNMDSGMFKPVQLAAAEALNAPDSWYESLNHTYRQRQQKVYQILDSLNCHYKKEQSGLFIWAKIASIYKNGFELSDKILHENHVFITPGGIFGSKGDQFIRISLCNDIDILEKVTIRIQQNTNSLQRQSARSR